jgi:hypothetical protein
MRGRSAGGTSKNKQREIRKSLKNAKEIDQDCTSQPTPQNRRRRDGHQRLTPLHLEIVQTAVAIF